MLCQHWVDDVICQEQELSDLSFSKSHFRDVEASLTLLFIIFVSFAHKHINTKESLHSHTETRACPTVQRVWNWIDEILMESQNKKERILRIILT